tara:strand:+ start:7901 stop:8584 length:684 start_codon:yes stop_codon:yes gene_type:complete
VKKIKMITLRDLADVNANFPSTKADLYNIDFGKPRSVSMPLFLYYAGRAKIIKSFYQKSEAQLKDGDVDIAFKANMNRFINLAINELDDREEVVKGAFSGLVQASLFKWILNSDTDIIAEEFALSEKVTINPGKGFSVITIPYFIYNELIAFMGTERNARITIIRVCQELQPKLKQSSSDEKRTWSRKIHNNLMAKMIDWYSNIDVLKGAAPSILDISLIPKHEDKK